MTEWKEGPYQKLSGVSLLQLVRRFGLEKLFRSLYGAESDFCLISFANNGTDPKITSLRQRV